MVIELEKTYLLKYLPPDLANFSAIEYFDIYFPTNAEHPKLRLRKRGQVYEITKKHPIKDKDSTQQYEFTINLTADEFTELESHIQGKRSRKMRYFYEYLDTKAEIDVYLDNLQGLIIADFEFTNISDMEKFQMPEFCLVEVSQDKSMAGGMLVGKKYEDIKPFLDSKDYKALNTGL